MVLDLTRRLPPRGLRSRLSISRSTAVRIRSERFSLGSKTASMRASVPAGNRAGVCSSLIFLRPTGTPLLISSIDDFDDIIYYKRYHLLQQGTSMDRIPLSEAEALNWLRAQPGGRITATDAELGRRWDWNRQRVGRRLSAWAKAGYIKRRGATVTVTGDVTVTATRDVTLAVTNAGTGPITKALTRGVPDSVVVPLPSRFLRRPTPASVPDPVPRAAQNAVTVVPPGRGGPFLTIALAGLAVAIWGVGVAINSWFAASLGNTVQASWLFIAIGMTADGFALLLPTTACCLAHARHYFGTAAAWLLWTATMAFALLAAWMTWPCCESR
jgi:hypothetical protein